MTTQDRHDAIAVTAGQVVASVERAAPSDNPAASYERLWHIFELAPIGIGIVDLEGHTVLSNHVLREMLGYSEAEFRALRFEEYSHPDDMARNDELFSEMVAGRLDRFKMDKRFFAKDGRVVWGHLTVSLLRDGSGAPALAIGMLENITERRRLEEQLREAEATFRLLVEQVPAVVYVAGREPGSPWTYVSPQIERILGTSAEEWLADAGGWLRRMHPDDRDGVLIDSERLMASGTDGAEVVHYRMRHADGSDVWIRDEFTMVRDEHGGRVFRGVLLDVTREKQLEAKLERQVFHDPLTGLANRDLFRDRVEHAIQRRLRARGRYAAVVFVDLDDFKTVNDSLGHAAGDELLRSVGRRIRGCTRPADTVARLGGDEFAVLLEDPGSRQEALAVADRLQHVLTRPHRLTDKTVASAASIGVAYLVDAERTDDVLRNADLAMYRAKELGKGRVATYEPVLHEAAVRRLELRSALEDALSREELAIHLQPIVDLVTARTVAAEALLRWDHPTFGAVPPEDFIPIAEETGAISRIGAWVLDGACRWLAGAREEGWAPRAVAVNISPVQLRSEDIATTVERCLHQLGVEPEALVLEVTEQALMDERSRSGLAALAELGVRIAMNDFGTGYASLAHLSELSVDILKIDRAFVAGLDGSEGGRAVPRAIVQLAHSLGLDVVAEGVETREQLDELRALGCRWGQGHLFARPRPLGELGADVDGPLLPGALDDETVAAGSGPLA